MPYTLVYPTFDDFQIGTTMVSNGWTINDQGSAATGIVSTYSSSQPRKCGRVTTTGGLWCGVRRYVTIGDIDYRIRVTGNNNNNTFITVRNNNTGGFFDNCYGLSFPGDLTNIHFVKMCGGSSYNLSTISKAHSMTDMNVRIVMTGLVMTAWINDSYIGSYDYTGNVLCSNATFNTGGYGLVAFSKTFNFMPYGSHPSLKLIR